MNSLKQIVVKNAQSDIKDELLTTPHMQGRSHSLATLSFSDTFAIRALRYAEWILSLSITARVLLLALNQQLNYSLGRGEYILFGVLGLLAIMSLMFPASRPVWQRRLYIFIEIACLLLVRTFSGWGLDIYLSLIFVKSCFLLRRKDVIPMTIVTGVAWHISLAKSLFDQYAVSSAEAKAAIEAYLALPTQYLVLEVVANNLVVYIALSFLAVLLSMTVLSERKNRQRAMELAQEVEVLATDLERNRIARDIHDSLGHTLTAMNMQLEVAQTLRDRNPAESVKALDRAIALSSQSLEEVRRAVSTMRGGRFDLSTALTTLAEQTMQTHSLAIETHLDLPDLPLQISQQLYLVIKEGLMNIKKHSQATTVRLAIWQALENVAIELSDDGVGFAPRVPSAGFGLRGMQERIQLLNGQLQIHSAEGRGTTLRITVPI